MADPSSSISPEENLYTITVGNILRSEKINVGTNAVISTHFFAPKDDDIMRMFDMIERDVVFEHIEPQQAGVFRLSDDPKGILEMLELEIRKGKFASLEIIKFWFAALIQISPNVRDHILATLSEPLAGVDNSITAIFATIRIDIEKLNVKADSGPNIGRQ